MMNVDIWSLFIILFVNALLQEFIIKPSVAFIKSYHKKAKDVFRNGFNEENIKR
jgi:hypothetical protein